MSNEAGARKSGRRGPGHTGLPSDSAKRAAAKKGGSKKSAEAEAPKDNSVTPDRERKPRAVVSRMASGKQGELPGVKVSDRKIVEIEDLAVIWEDTKLALARAKELHLDADENLVASMRRHNRTQYSRQTFGTVKVPDPKVHAKFKREKN